VPCWALGESHSCMLSGRFEERRAEEVLGKGLFDREVFVLNGGLFTFVEPAKST
jgi:hypothetical protein